MTVALRPMSVGEILDRTFQIYRSRFLVFVGIAILAPLVRIPISLLGMIFKGVLAHITLSSSTKLFLQQPVPVWLANLAVALAFSALFPTACYVASREFLNEKSTIRGSIAQCTVRWRSWIPYSVIVCAILYGVPAGVNAIVSAGRLQSTIQTGFFGGSDWDRLSENLLITTGSWLLQFCMGAVVVLSAPVWIVEGLAMGAAIRRGLRMARHSVALMFAAWCLKSAILWILATGTSTVLTILYRTIPSGGWGDTILREWYRLIYLIPGFVSGVFVMPISPIAITLIYYDQQIRKEGYDIERMMDAAGMTAIAAPVAATAGDAISMSADSAGAEVQPR